MTTSGSDNSGISAARRDVPLWGVVLLLVLLLAFQVGLVVSTW